MIVACQLARLCQDNWLHSLHHWLCAVHRTDVQTWIGLLWEIGTGIKLTPAYFYAFFLALTVHISQCIALVACLRMLPSLDDLLPSLPWWTLCFVHSSRISRLYSLLLEAAMRKNISCSASQSTSIVSSLSSSSFTRIRTEL